MTASKRKYISYAVNLQETLPPCPSHLLYEGGETSHMLAVSGGWSMKDTS